MNNEDDFSPMMVERIRSLFDSARKFRERSRRTRTIRVRTCEQQLELGLEA